ncbi:KIN14B-interacting protein At4g14310-like [Corylus avellana]|uniref:KIN14B-interacting protein At4g14310-like n=1 Tax=Corylus avellana TaxID=13451 RepID=UPI001E237FD1|nr:KIN14B-interacting protein At4g14310-like [Corylus avellana]
MSASSARRLRDHGTTGAGVAAKPSKALTPIWVSGKSPTVGLQRSSSCGKENPRPASRTRDLAQKPVIRPVPRVDKAAAAARSVDPGSDSGTRVRWSTSSAPRGRSPSPSELIRGFSDRRVSVGASAGGKGLESGKQRKGFRDSSVNGSEGKTNGVRAFRDRKESCRIGVNSEKRSGLYEDLEMKVEENEKNLKEIRSLENCNGKVNLGSNVIKLSAVGRIFDEKVRDGAGVDEFLKSNKEVVKVGNDVGLCVEGRVENTLDNGKVLEIPKDKGLDGNKYPSKLHEKLAFLEGKVKRIASDIKRTKEMLDMNNPDSSKIILSDIQDKISGIQKAIGNVGGESDGKIGLSRGAGDGESRIIVQKEKSKEAYSVNTVKSSVKGLSSEELEARLFPHHKLLRNRTFLKVTSAGSQSHEPHFEGPNCELKVDKKSFSPIDDNPIAMEFLASLNTEQTKVTIRDGQAGLECCEVQEMDGDTSTGVSDCSNVFNGKRDVELVLTTDERLDDFDDQERIQGAIIGEETEDSCIDQLNEIGHKASTAGWFISEGEAVLLAHDDGSCSFYDIVNCEEKAEYKPPSGVSPGIWRDCWIIRAPGADGCSGKYVVAASAGNAISPGFCCWDFYSKDVQAFQLEGGAATSRTVLGPLPNNIGHRRNSILDNLVPENQQWWYKPCGPLIISTASCQRGVRIFDIRDGEQIMKWEVQKPVSTMDYSSPLQWRSRGKVVLAEAEAISVWDVNSQSPQALLSVSSSGQKISALHVNNTDAESSGGVRQRVSSSEAEGHDGVFCTADSINIMDFRHPYGVGLKIPKLGVSAQSVFSRGDSVFLGCSNVRSRGRKQTSSQVQQFSLRKQRLFSTYELPESNAHFHHSAITQVWGNSSLVMGVCGLGLFVFDALRDDPLQSFTIDSGSTKNVRDAIGPDDMYSPSFDYLSSRALVISRDRPAMWRHLS